jgi:hypothetical protein
MSIWNVYRYTRKRGARGRFELLASVEAAHQPAARREAIERWPRLACASPGYPSGRLVVRASEADPFKPK